MIYTAIFQNKTGHYAVVVSHGGPDRKSAWNSIQKNEAPSENHTLKLLIPGAHVVLRKEDLYPTPTIDPFELNY
tara:strand:+ start:4893 stop:5114 length:222 start_codon:yes stop_codon:yes gene_type:complete